MSLAIAVMIAVSATRSSARPRGPARTGRWRDEVGDDVDGVGRRAAVAERQQPPAGIEASRGRAIGRFREHRGRALERRGSAARAPRRAFISTERAHVGEDRVEIVLALGQERIQEARRTGVVRRGARCAPRAARDARRTRAPAPTARGRWSRPAPGGRTDRRSAAPAPTRRRAARRRSSSSRARGPSTDPPRAGAPPTARRRRSRCRRARPAARARCARAPDSPASPSAGSARLPTITGCTNSTATWRTSERAAGRARPRSDGRRGRSARPSGDRAARSARPRAEKKALAEPRGAAPGDPRAARASALADRSELMRTAWTRLCASSASHSRNSSTPSPVLRADPIVRTPGLTASML